MTGTNPGPETPEPGPVPAGTFTEMVCRHCMEPLVRIGSEGGGTFHHGRSGESDHDADPIPMAEAVAVKYYCDFCGLPDDVVWSYPTRQEVNHILATPTHTGKEHRRQIGKHTFHHTRQAGPAQDLGRNVYSARWSACGSCAALIDIPDLERLIQRLRRTNEDFTSLTRSYLRNFFAEFFRTKLPREPLNRPGHTEENR